MPCPSIARRPIVWQRGGSRAASAGLACPRPVIQLWPLRSIVQQQESLEAASPGLANACSVHRLAIDSSTAKWSGSGICSSCPYTHNLSIVLRDTVFVCAIAPCWTEKGRNQGRAIDSQSLLTHCGCRNCIRGLLLGARRRWLGVLSRRRLGRKARKLIEDPPPPCTVRQRAR